MPAALTDQELQFLQDVLDLARAGDVEQLRFLLDAGVPANLTNSSRDTLLILAAYHVHLPVVQLLLERGADTERVNDHGQTALGAAVFRRDEPIARALLAAGADPDTGPRSARQVAQFFGLDDMTRLLDSYRLDSD
jgi:ankyrin repeat protein